MSFSACGLLNLSVVGPSGWFELVIFVHLVVKTSSVVTLMMFRMFLMALRLTVASQVFSVV